MPFDMESPLKKLFEHRLPAKKGQYSLSYEQLRKGLLYYFKNPKFFIPHLDEVTISDQTKNKNYPILERILDFGSFKVEDKVVFLPDDLIRISVAANEKLPEAMLEVRIERNRLGSFDLNFFYYEDPVRDPDEYRREILELRKAAWEAQDKTIVDLICDLAFSGNFDTKQ